MPTVPEVFAEMKKKYTKGAMEKNCTYYFSLDDYKYTVTFENGRILIEEGKTVDSADCVLKTSAEMFIKMWGGYKPSMMEFMSGKVKTSNPNLLQEFVKAFN